MRMSTQLAAAAMIVAITACGVPRYTQPQAPAPIRMPGDLLGWFGWAATALGCIALIAGVLGIVFASNKYRAIQGIIAGVTLTVTGQLLTWFGTHMVGVTVACVACGLVAAGLYAWKNREKIERALDLDLDRDGDVGGRA